MGKLEGPGRHPLEILKFVRRPDRFFRDGVARWGETFRVVLPGFGETIVFTRPQHIGELFMADREHLEWGDNGFLEPVLGRHSLLVAEGELHKRHRKMLMPPFHGERMRAYGDLMRDITRAEIGRWDATVNMQRAAARITINVIARTIFGVDEEARAEQACDQLGELLDRMGPSALFAGVLRVDLGPWSPWGRLVRGMRRVDALIAGEVAARRDDPRLDEREDVLSMILSARGEDGEPLGDDVIRDSLLTLLVAGHETTATALAWAAHWLSHNPDVLARLREEVDGVGSDAPSEEIAKLPYLSAVCDETLRIEPILPETARVVRKPVTIGGVDLDAGTYVMPAIWATHHRPELYPEPDRFQPERFLGRRFGPYEFLPFGGGVHKCLGYAFALYEMKIVLFALVRSVDFRATPGQKIVPSRRNLSVGPSGGVWLEVGARR